MSDGARHPIDDLRGAGRLAVAATHGVVDVVEAMHRSIARGPAVLGYPLERVFPVFTTPVYAAIRAITSLSGGALDGVLAQLHPLFAEGTPGPQREALRAALNGVLGDYLSETGNPLAITMGLLQQGVPLRAPIRDARRVLVMVHGSSMSPRQWTRRGHDHGEALARDLGYTVVHLRYNTGLHVSSNGRALAGLLEEVVASADEIALLGYSMGGLVARSACHSGEVAGHAWRSQLRALICLGSPHHGAPLERAASFSDALLGVSRHSAPLRALARIRSAGLTDMRSGNVLDEHWRGQDRFALWAARSREPLPLPAGVSCCAAAATTSPGPAARLRSDGLVPVASALGEHDDPALALDFRRAWVGFGMDHFDLLDDPRVYETLRGWLACS